MKSRILFFLFLFISISVLSQEAKTAFIGFSVGPSIPQGNYAKCDITNDQSGYAMQGMYIGVQGSYKFHKNVGVLFMYNGASHRVKEYETWQLHKPVLPGSMVDVESGYLFSGSMVIGPTLILPFDRAECSIYGLAGFSSSTIPEIVINSWGGGDGILTQNETTAAALAYTIGGELMFYLGKKFALIINMDYYKTTPEFDVAYTSNYGYSADEVFEQEFEMLNISIGVGYRFK